MYRILSAHQQVRERRDQMRHPRYQAPELIAKRPNLGQIRKKFFHINYPILKARVPQPKTTQLLNPFCLIEKRLATTLLGCLTPQFRVFWWRGTRVLFDNMKTVVVGRDLVAGTIQYNDRFRDFCGYYGFRARLACRIERRPRGRWRERSVMCGRIFGQE